MPKDSVRIQYAHRAFLNGPCIDCTERHLRCHSECARYQEWLAKGRSAYEEYKQRKDVELYDAHDALTGRMKGRKNDWEK